VSRSSPEAYSLVERSTHDLLNPISALLGLGETMRDRGASLGDETVRAFGDSIVRQAGRLEQAVRDLGRASLLLRGEPAVTLVELAASELLSPFASERVRIEVPPGLTLRGDRDLLAEALIRLIDNALTFSTDEVIVSAGRDGTTWIEVADHGAGFSSEALAHIFEPLSAGTNARNERGPGLGLGLYIARRYIEAQGGTLTVRSTAGEGSVFRIELPA